MDDSPIKCPVGTTPNEDKCFVTTGIIGGEDVNEENIKIKKEFEETEDNVSIYIIYIL